jgi:hypothetical protein
MDFGLLTPSSIIGSLGYWKSNVRDSTVWRNKLFSVMQELAPYYLLHHSGSDHPDAALYPVLISTVRDCVAIMEKEDPSFRSVHVPNFDWDCEGGHVSNLVWMTRMILDPELTAARVHGWYFTPEQDFNVIFA